MQNATITQLLEPRAPQSPFQLAATQRRNVARAHFDALAPERERWIARSTYYYEQLGNHLRFVIPPGKSVLELGCGTGDLLAGLQPSRGVGIDFSPRMLEIARRKHPGLTFVEGAVEEVELDETFDFVVLSDLICHLDDVWLVLRRLHGLVRPDTRVVITTHNAVWEPALSLAERLGRKIPVPQPSWLGMDDIENLLALNHFDVVSKGTLLLLPTRVPVLSRFANRYLANLPGIRHLNLVQVLVARPNWQDAPPEPKPLSCSVIVPTRNERGNVRDIFDRTPEMGPRTELVFVDGKSDDGTVEEIERLLPTREGLLLHQTGLGKGGAVREAFEAATGDIYFILDSDLTVPPEDLPKFYLAIAEGKGEFVNGTRLVYPMEDEAMRFLNLLGNKFFSVVLSGILGQRLKDTLCGTKVMTAENYAKIAAGREFFGDFDPFGDFDLIFGAAKQQLKIVEVPIRYRARTYGEIKISRFRHGLMLLQMTAVALQKFKFSFEN